MKRPLSFVLALAPALATVAAQETPPPEVQWVPASAVDASAGWLSLVDRSTLTVGRYRLSAGAQDGQAPHDRDEIYYVLAGKGEFQVGDYSRPFAAGDTVFVAAAAKRTPSTASLPSAAAACR